MMRERFVSILLSPVSIALVLTVVVGLFLPDDLFQKYKVETVEEVAITTLEKPQNVRFTDIDGNGSSEKISIYHNAIGEVSISVRPRDGAIVNQWNLEGKLLYMGRSIAFFDLNGDDTLEVIFPTLTQNTIYLNILQPYVGKGKIREVVLYKNDQYELDRSDIIPGGHFIGEDINGDLNKEFIFSLNGGYQSVPRNAFVYDFTNDTIYMSPYLCNKLYPQAIADLNKDGQPEIILSGGSADNHIDTTEYNCTDDKSYLTVLDAELNFFFPRIVHDCIYSGHQLAPLPTEGDSVKMLVYRTSRVEAECLPELLMLSPEGKILHRKSFEQFDNTLLSSKDFQKHWLYNYSSGDVYKISPNLETRQVKSIEKSLNFKKLQRIKSLQPYWMGLGSNRKKVVLFEEDFEHPIAVNYGNPDNENVYVGTKQESDKPFQFYIQVGDDYYIYEYFQNPIYAFRFLPYPGIFLVFLGIVFLGIKGQNIREQRKREIEEEIARLQLKSIKNQVDPHFVFNSINTISAMLLEEDKEAADRFITKFAKLMRQTLRGSDKISTTLEDELAYIENYIQLQQVRFNHRFEFAINIDPSIDLARKIPKHVLFTYVENAIKHGLAHKEQKGFLSVDVLQKDGRLRLVVEDNGIGEQAKLVDNPYSTGRGMKIMEQIFSLYQRIHKIRITHRVIPLCEKDGTPNGLRVQIDFDG